MASTKISQLPLQTATTTNDIVAIVDSGNTTTSKIDLQTLFRASGSTINQTSASQNNLILASSQSTITDTASPGGTGDNAIIASTSATIDKNQGARTAIIASNEVRISNDQGEGAMNAIISSYGSTTEVEGGFANTIISGKGGSRITRGENNTMISTQGGDIQYGGNQVLLGTNYFSMNSSYNSVGMASESGTISNHRYTMVGAHYQYNESDSGNQCVVLGGENNTLSSRGGFASWKSMMSVKNSTCQDEGASMIATSGRSSNHTWTLHTDNIHTYKTETFTESNGGNVGGSVSIDCSQSTFYFFTMTADTSVNFTNVRDGQRFMFIVYNNGTWSVTGATLNGSINKVYAKNGSINPTNNGYSKYVATYDSINGYLFLDEELGFSAV